MTETEKIHARIAILGFIIWLNHSKDLWIRDDDGEIKAAGPLISEHQEAQENESART
jgi:hypothetical protein